MHINAITGQIIETAIDIHRHLGPGLLESVYHEVLVYELRKRGRHVDTEVPIPVEWDNIKLELGFRADLVVDRQVIVELKSLEATAPVHRKQVLTYLKISGLHVGLLINFGEELLKDGVFRLVNRFAE